MKKFCAVIFMLLLCGAAFAEEFPKLGRCSGKGVRLREVHGSKGEVIGKADPDTQLLILGEQVSDGEKWYKIAHPIYKGNAWIHSQFVNIAYGKDDVFLDVRQTFGISPTKTKAIFGEPEKVVEAKFGSDERAAFYYDYPAFRAWFDTENYSIISVFVENGGPAILGVKAGDKAEKLLKLGMPKNTLKLRRYENGESETEVWQVKSNNGEKVIFGISLNEKDEAVIDSISWSIHG